MIYFAFHGFYVEDTKVLINFGTCSDVQRNAASSIACMSGCDTEWLLSLIAAFKQRPAALLYPLLCRGKILQHFRSARNVGFSA